MHAISNHPAQGVLSAPLTSWCNGHSDPSDRGTLTKVVTGTLSSRKRITALGHFFGLSGESRHLEQWESLALTASIDVAVARMLEPHIDALSILVEAGTELPPGESSWGVFAAEAPGKELTVITEVDGRIVVDGEKAWCSLASELSHAIVTADHDGRRQACAVSLTDPRVRPDGGEWPSLGLQEIPSGSVTFDRAPARTIGPPGWYLDRPSFAWGGIRVAACWFGGALGLAQNAARRHFARPGPSPLGDMSLGQLDAQIFIARSVLAQAASAADGEDDYTPDQAWSLAMRVRNIVYRTAQHIQHLSRELAGPAALTGDRRFAKADADLTVYLSQHHGPRDEASLGGGLMKEFGLR